MADGTVPVALPLGAVPTTYTVPAATTMTVRAVRAVFDGSAAATSFVPVVQFLNSNGAIMAQTRYDSTVLAGGSADVSFFPRVKRRVTNPSVLTYYQVIAALSSTNSLVGEWHLTEGASPWADTSGSTVGGNGQMLIQVLGTAMTQNNPAGPLTSNPAGPSVKFNYDGTNPPAQGDYLHTSLAPLGRFTFAGNLPYTVLAWIKPVSGTNTHFGGVLTDVVATNIGTPAEVDDGWGIVVKASTLECQVQRYCSVPFGAGGSPDVVSLGAMSTTEWTMVAMTYDGATLRGYANGTLVGSTASAGAIGGAQDALIGLLQGLGLSSWYLGAVSEASIWASQLSTDQLALLYLAGIS